MRTKLNLLLAVAAMMGSLAVAAPAQAAPPATISQTQVNETTNRSTVRGPYTTKFGVTIDLRAGYYQGYQYGWARVTDGRWQRKDVIWLRIFQNGSWNFVHGSLNEFGDGRSPTITAGQITLADPNYRFSACLQRAGQGYDCTPEW